MMGNTSRREFVKTAAVAAISAPLFSAAHRNQVMTEETRMRYGVDLLRTPDRATARFGGRELVPMQYSAHAWKCKRIRVVAEPLQAGGGSKIPVRVSNEGEDLTHLHLRWEGKQSEALVCIGDAWERSYGDLEWRTTVPERVMPWYFLTFDGERVDGYGVETLPSALCFWQHDSDGITLTIDIRNGGSATELRGRELEACTIVTRQGAKGETIADAAQQFCKLMCQRPRLPAGSIFGSNDWNYAYGKNTAEGILRDADLIAALAPAGTVRPHVVIDDGWQDPHRFPSMSALADQIRTRNLHPGLWIRPLRADGTAPPSWLLPDARFGKNAAHTNLAFDPTHPEALEAAMKPVRTTVQWGYGFIKHDFTTWELLGRWGSAMRAEITDPGWHFYDRSRTNAEIIRAFYQAIRSAAGADTTILGCNTVSHLAAGIFDSQRVADDTSGHDWERTRRFGVNGLAHRIAQHRTFYHVDPDCVAITAEVGWNETSQWMDVVARSGTSLFLSPEPSAITPEIKSAMRDAMFLAAQGNSGHPTHPTESTTPSEWQFSSPAHLEKTYDWVGPEGVSPFDV
jgi:alpha-galactosidase